MNARVSSLALSAVALLGVGCETYTARDPLLDRPIFERVWYDRGVDWGAYQSVVVHPIRIETMDIQERITGDLEAANSRVLETVARYTQVEIARATGGTASTETGPGTLVIEAVIVELRPSRVRNQGELRFNAEVQLEARIRDGADGRVLATFLDRRTSGEDRAFRQTNWEDRARHEILRWAAGFGGALRFMADGSLDSSSPFDFARW